MYMYKFIKVDLVKPDAALAQHEQIRKFVAGTVADAAPVRRSASFEILTTMQVIPTTLTQVIPISAVLKYNIDCVCEYIAHAIPVHFNIYNNQP
jgi:translation initiation factor 2 subunit 3